MESWIVILGLVPFLIGMAGTVAQRIILGDARGRIKQPKEGWSGLRRVYWVTIPLHAIAVGCFLGFVGWGLGFPLPAVFGERAGGAVLAYGISGAISVVGYDVLVKTIKRVLGSYQLGSGVSGDVSPGDSVSERDEQRDEQANNVNEG